VEKLVKSIKLVDYEGMNEVHRNEVEILNRLYGSLDGGKEEEIDELLRLFLEDVERHFSYEEELMRKTRFFAYPCHKEEHDKLRQELRQLLKEWEENRDREQVKRYLKNRFVLWLEEHLNTMDEVTARWINSTLNRIGAIQLG
jgi:hemerythrin